MKRILSLFVCFLMLFLCIALPSEALSQEMHWYCTRQKAHRQALAAPELRFVEECDGYYIDHTHADGDAEKVVYLTFDAGYENGNVKKILDILKEEQVLGAFFILGNLIQKNPELIRQMTEDGHTVCNHTNHHKDMTRMDCIEEFQRELESLETLYREATGKELSKFYRPPEGKFDERSLSFASELGYTTVFWSLAYADWDNQKQPSPTVAKKILLDHLHNGAVILLHPTSQTNALILKELIVTLKAQGYRFGTMDELVKNKKDL